MAGHRPKVPSKVKSVLLDEAGGACSNPGCANTVLELHHIRAWAVYQSHDADHMIALCPACHSSVTRGELRITDDVLYSWKAETPRRWAAVDLPPATLQKMLIGSVSVTGPRPFAVFDFDTQQSLSFSLDLEGEVLTLNATVADGKGESMLVMRQNTVSRVADHVRLHKRPGRVRASVDDWQSLFPLWAYRQLCELHPADVMGGVPLFDVEVVRPGVVRVSGIWASSRRAAVITRTAVAFHTNPHAPYPLSIQGAGERTVLHVDGPGVLFGLEGAPSRQPVA